LEGSENILHHTVGGSEGSRGGRQRERGIAWPARHLAREIGPRAPGSNGERSAARFVEKEVRSLGLEPEVQSFRAPTTTAWSELLVHAIPLLGVAVFPLNSHASFVLVFPGFLFFLLEYYGRSPFIWMQAHRRSENVISRLKPAREERRKLVVIAHLDTPRTAFYRGPAFLWMIRSAFLLDFACMAALFMLSAVAYAGFLLSMESETLDFIWYVSLIISIVPALAFIALLAKALGSSTPGGNDNASGVAVLLELVRTYHRRQPLFTELWLVWTGGADASGAGVKRLLRRYRRELRGAYFVVMDGVGRGFPVCYRREGRLVPFRANRRLIGVVKSVNDTHAHYGAGFRRNNLYLGEGFQLISRGRRAITVSSRDESRYPRYWRCVRDDYDNIDVRSLRLSLDLMIAFIDSIDRGGLK